MTHRTIGLLVLSESIYLMGVIEGEVLPTSVPHKGLQEGVRSPDLRQFMGGARLAGKITF
jgi:hypothetical protein